MQPGKLRSLRRLVDADGTLAMLAIDQRPPVERLVAERRHLERGQVSDVVQIKRVLAEELAPLASAVLLDPLTSIGEMGILRADQGLLVTLEDAVFDDRGHGRSSRWIEDWSVDKIKRLGGDGVKLLAWYRPDAAPEVVDHQRELVETTGQACRHFDIPFVLELLVHPLDGDDERALEGSRRAEVVLESVATFSDDRFGVDVFKVESPFRATELPVFGDDDEAHRAVFWELSRTIDRPWVLLSGGAERGAFANALRYAYDAGASGYLAGRSIWWDAVDRFPDWEDMRAVLRTDSAPFMVELNEMTRAMATPVFERFGVLTEALLERPGVDFRQNYGSMVDEQATRRPTMMGAVR